VSDNYLAEVEHETLHLRRGARSGLYCIIAVHSTVLGPGLGGCRMWPYDDARAAMRDALRLSRGMTYKSAVAGNPLGGGKGVIMLRPDQPLTPKLRRAALLDFGDTVQELGGAYVTAEDVGVSTRDMDLIATRTPHVTGRARRHGGSGDPSPYTALGVQVALLAACEHHFGSVSLNGRTVAVVGLGHVGMRLARLLARRGAKLLVTDINPARRAEAEKLGARWVSAARALTAPVDVYCPCALGGVLDDESVPAIQAPVIAGAANNQLADDSIARLLVKRGITWAPDFVANAGGIINISVELEPEGYDPRRARARVQAIGDTVSRVLDTAAREQTTPLAAAMALADARLMAQR
jgi:leucine dehydrogenase